MQAWPLVISVILIVMEIFIVWKFAYIFMAETCLHLFTRL